jgi:hypothetical protein
MLQKGHQSLELGGVRRVEIQSRRGCQGEGYTKTCIMEGNKGEKRGEAIVKAIRDSK